MRDQYAGRCEKDWRKSNENLEKDIICASHCADD